MERSTPVRKPHTSTADLLTWSENPAADSSETASAARSSARSHQPSDGIQKVVFGGQVTDEEVESLNKRKPVSGYKLKEITGSGIFASGGENNVEEADAANRTPASKTGLRMYQQTVAGISHISFGEEETVSPKKALSEAKQRELSGTLDSESDAKLKKQFSNAKNKELSGHNIFAPPPEIQPRPLAARALALRESISIGESAPSNTNAEEPVMKTAKKIPSQKFTELSGNNIFKGDEPPASAEKPLSSAKLREMSGSNIFADGKAESRDYLGGVRKPPGGESSIALTNAEEPVMKTAKKIPSQKFTELSGNNIFKGDEPPASAEKPLSSAKLREMSGSNIFADGKAESRDYLGGVRKPPGGESSIALV